MICLQSSKKESATLHLKECMQVQEPNDVHFNFSQLTNCNETVKIIEFESSKIRYPYKDEHSVRLFKKSKFKRRYKEKEPEFNKYSPKLPINEIAKQGYDTHFNSVPGMFNCQTNFKPAYSNPCAKLFNQICEVQCMQFQMMVDCHTKIISKLIDRI